jgi:hypothetical protein
VALLPLLWLTSSSNTSTPSNDPMEEDEEVLEDLLLLVFNEEEGFIRSHDHDNVCLVARRDLVSPSKRH